MQERSQNELPIDIHSNKLLDWLVSRRHCSRDYTEDVLVIREKINGAIQDMPAAEEITKLLTGAYINYFHCLQIVDILKETESQTKNIFGRYSSQRMKDWQEIVKHYQKDNVYLAEAAQMLIRNVNFEVPSLKRHMAHLRHQQEDYEKKHNDCIKSAKDVKDKYQQSCKRLGIKGSNVREELLEVVKDLPNTHKKVVSSCRSLIKGMTYYRNFLVYASGKDNAQADATLPVTSYLLKKGNTTVYEWKFEQPPTKIEETQAVPESANDNEEEIDFGGDGIDFGSTEIDFDTGASIDFGEGGESVDQAESNVTEVKPSDGVARGENALSILDCSNTRSLFMNELFEMEAFLEQRLVELGAESDLLSVNQFQNAPDSLQNQSIESVEPMLTSFRDMINLLNDAKLQQLFLVKASPRYVDRLTDTLKQQLAIADKLLTKSELMKQKRQEAVEEEMLLGPKIELIIAKTRVLQKEIETDISNKYNNRIVNIVGGINAL